MLERFTDRYTSKCTGTSSSECRVMHLAHSLENSQVTPVFWNIMALPQVAQRHCERTFIQADNGCRRLPTLGLHVPLFKCKISPINAKTKTTPATDCLNDKLSQFFFLSLYNSLELSSSFCANPEREKAFRDAIEKYWSRYKYRADVNIPTNLDTNE